MAAISSAVARPAVSKITETRYRISDHLPCSGRPTWAARSPLPRTPLPRSDNTSRTSFKIFWYAGCTPSDTADGYGAAPSANELWNQIDREAPDSSSAHGSARTARWCVVRCVVLGRGHGVWSGAGVSWLRRRRRRGELPDAVLPFLGANQAARFRALVGQAFADAGRPVTVRDDRAVDARGRRFAWSITRCRVTRTSAVSRRGRRSSARTSRSWCEHST